MRRRATPPPLWRVPRLLKVREGGAGPRPSPHGAPSPSRVCGAPGGARGVARRGGGEQRQRLPHPQLRGRPELRRRDLPAPSHRGEPPLPPPRRGPGSAGGGVWRAWAVCHGCDCELCVPPPLPVCPGCDRARVMCCCICGWDSGCPCMCISPNTYTYIHTLSFSFSHARARAHQVLRTWFPSSPGSLQRPMVPCGRVNPSRSPLLLH